MDRNDQQAIDGLFAKLAQVERQSGPRDADAERFIADRIGSQPAAPYLMAQTIVVQEQALEAAQRRIQELESRNASASQPQRGGLLSGLFGSSAPPAATARPQPQPAQGRPQGMSSPWGGQAGGVVPRQGGGFLAGAAQTAMGVAGGVLLGNALMGMFGNDEAQASEPEEPQADEMDFGDDMEF